MAERPHRGRSRGVDPEDGRFFSGSALEKLRTAGQEAAWLMARGYAQGAVIELVGNHHQLSSRQRLAVLRCAATDAQCMSRAARCLPLSALPDGPLMVDGFNVIIALEVALSGGLLLRGRDGVLRDLAGLRGTYRLIRQTEEALDILFRAAEEDGVPALVFWLDAPVSNSGRLRSAILDHARHSPVAAEVMLVPNPDRPLSRMERVVTGDSAILDRCPSWFNWVPRLLPEGAQVVDLGAEP